MTKECPYLPTPCCTITLAYIINAFFIKSLSKVIVLKSKVNLYQSFSLLTIAWQKAALDPKETLLYGIINTQLVLLLKQLFVQTLRGRCKINLNLSALAVFFSNYKVVMTSNKKIWMWYIEINSWLLFTF